MVPSGPVIEIEYVKPLVKVTVLVMLSTGIFAIILPVPWLRKVRL